MADLGVNLDDLLAQWRVMAQGDRKAVLKRLPLEQRMALERALTRRDDKPAVQAQSDSAAREFAVYSPPLADLVAGCVRDDARAAALTPAVREAVCTAHRDIAAAPPVIAPPSLWDILHLRLREWGLLP